MARLQPLAVVDAARSFRESIRPSLLGYLGQVEPIISARAAAAMKGWLEGVIRQTMVESRLKDPQGVVLQQLLMGARVTGAYSLNSLQGAVWTYPYLFTQEYGGDITPKNAKYLALPIFYALRPDGTPIFRNPRSWDRYGAFVYTQKSTGKKFLAYHPKLRGKGQLRILYILVDKVTIPKRLGLNDHINAAIGDLLSMWGSIYVEEMVRAGIVSPENSGLI